MGHVGQCHKSKLATAGVYPNWSAEEFARLRSEGVLGARQRFQYTWDKVRGRRPHDTPALRALLDEQHWRDGAAELVGGAGSKDIRSWLELSQADRNKWRSFGTQRDLMLPVIPYYDAPGRISGLAVMGVKINHHFTSKEAGFAFLPALERSNSVIGTHVVAMPDLWQGLRLHLRHIDTDVRSLPLLVWHHGPRNRTERAWECLDGRIPVIWDQTRASCN